MQNLKIFIIAGEDSGDRLGADILKAIYGAKQNFEINGIAGPLMQKQGMESLFPMQDIAVMGIFEIIPKLPSLMNRIHQTVEAIKKFKPDILLSIDCPDFSFRVQKRIKDMKDISPHHIHLVAPTVWAWRPGRARHISHFLDQILCLFPFEPAYFEKVGLNASFVGHPIIDQIKENSGNVSDNHSNKLKYNKKIGVYCGSRRSEVKRHASIFSQTCQEIAHQDKDVHFFIPGFLKFEDELKTAFENLETRVTYVFDEDKKRNVMTYIDCALAVNGTVGLELACHKVPHVSAYITSKTSYSLAKRLIKLKYIHLVNILSEHNCLNDMQVPIIPEFIQDGARPKALAKSLKALLSGEKSADYTKQQNAFKHLEACLQTPNHKGFGQMVLDCILANYLERLSKGTNGRLAGPV